MFSNTYFSSTRFQKTYFSQIHGFQILVFRNLKYMFSKTRLFSNTHFEIHIFKTTNILGFKTGIWKQHEISNFYKNIFTIFKNSILKRVSQSFSSNMRFQIHVFFKYSFSKIYFPQIHGFQILVFRNLKYMFSKTRLFSNTHFKIRTFKNDYNTRFKNGYLKTTWNRLLL